MYGALVADCMGYSALCQNSNSNLRYSDWEERIGRPTLVKDYSEPVYIVEDVATPTKLGGNGGISCKDNIEVEQF